MNKNVIKCDLVFNGSRIGQVFCDWDMISLCMKTDLKYQVYDLDKTREEILQDYLKLDPEFKVSVYYGLITDDKEV
jgi:hypothetical protein